jgi:hypothetical protein
LYKRITCRTPLFLIIANREGLGKDYLAGVVGIIYEGVATDDTPFAMGGKKSSDSEELRKKITSFLRTGKKRIHSANNKGYLNNAILEQILTTEYWADRILGKNETINLPNELDFSLSANVGLSYSADLARRSRPINLFFAGENPNTRVFKNPDLQGYVKENRDLILSAIFTLILDWYNAGKHKSDSIFTSFPEWARVVGGIMNYHKLGDPCVQVEDDNVGGDKETMFMKEIYEYMIEKKAEKVTVADIRNLLLTEDAPQCYYNLEEREGQTKFGLLIKRFAGRELKNIKLEVAEPNPRAARVKYCFKKIDKKTEPKKEQQNGKGGDDGNNLTQIPFDIHKNIRGIASHQPDPGCQFFEKLPQHLLHKCAKCRETGVDWKDTRTHKVYCESCKINLTMMEEVV